MLLQSKLMVYRNDFKIEIDLYFQELALFQIWRKVCLPAPGRGLGLLK
jgi:hypothetical protein